MTTEKRAELGRYAIFTGFGPFPAEILALGVWPATSRAAKALADSWRPSGARTELWRIPCRKRKGIQFKIELNCVRLKQTVHFVDALELQDWAPKKLKTTIKIVTLSKKRSK